MGDWQQRVETHRLFHDQPRRLGWFCQFVLSQKTPIGQWRRGGSWIAFGSRHNSLKNYTTNQILNGKARSATYFFQRRTIDDVSIISAFFNNPFIQIEYVWMNWVRRKKQLRSCKFSRHDDSHIFRYNKWLLKKKFTLFLYLFTSSYFTQNVSN